MTELHAGDVAYLGIGSDINSTHLRGAAEAPAKVREVLHNGASGLTAETGAPVIDDPRFRDLGDNAIGDSAEEFLGIEKLVTPIVNAGARPLIVGGDHAITYPILRAVAQHHGPLNVLHFDAHSDLYDEFEGNRLSHACPFARIMEEGLAKRLVQVGIRSVNAHLLAQTERFAVEVHPMNAFRAERVPLHFDGPTYLTFDLDALDPAFAPGVSHHEPGGLSVRQCLYIIQNLRATLVGADIVEFNPRRDLHDMTAMVAAKLVREIGARLLTPNKKAR
jgi:agmatinase